MDSCQDSSRLGLLIFLLSPGFSTIALVPTASRYQFQYAGSGPLLIDTRFLGAYLHFSHFGTSSVPSALFV